jgi:glycopeptide antibiotics resistance protein
MYPMTDKTFNFYIKDKLVKVVLSLSAFVYISLLISLLFFKNREYISYNFLPFHEIKRYLFAPGLPTRLVLENLLGNIVLFIPLGIYLSLLFRRRFISLLLTATLSAAAELIQLHFALGSCDVDDIILNTLGGALGIALYFVLARLLNNEKRLRCVIAVLAALCSVLAIFGWLLYIPAVI